MTVEIPHIRLGTAPLSEAVARAPDRADDMLRCARRRLTPPVVALGERLTRRWAERRLAPEIAAEIEAVARALGRDGAWMMNLSYEWGCTTGCVPDAAGRPRLMRTLDWRLDGLGRNAVAVERRAPAGPWVNLGWPGFVGVIQAVAPFRFAASINQAPMPAPGTILPLDWAIARARVWRAAGEPPAMLLRRVFDTAPGFAAALAMLETARICRPAIFSLAGVAEGEFAIVEKSLDRTFVHRDRAAVANRWLTPALRGVTYSWRPAERRRAMEAHVAQRSDGFAWLAPPILNRDTRLALEACPATGEIAAVGYERGVPATSLLSLRFGANRPALADSPRNMAASIRARSSAVRTRRS